MNRYMTDVDVGCVIGKKERRRGREKIEKMTRKETKCVNRLKILSMIAT